MPVIITNTAVKEGTPPSCSVILIATGVVTDLGASDNKVAWLAPKYLAIKRVLKLAKLTPKSSAKLIDSHKRLSLATCLYKGKANPTVAGPSKK